MSLPNEVLKKVKLLEISTRKLVNNTFSGEYHTAFKGQGMTFADFREYVPGDDIRTISWPLTARTGKPYIKTFEEERELTLFLVVDVSGSTNFGSNEYFKGEVINHLSALLSLSAVKNNDQVGLLLVSHQVELYVPPKKGRGHVQRIFRELYYYKPQSQKTQLASAFTFLQGILKKRATVFILSDFVDQGFETSLKLLGKKHDVVACIVEDPLEKKAPQIGIVDIQDAETGEILTIDTDSKEFQNIYQTEYTKMAQERAQKLRKSQVDSIDLTVSPDFVDPLIRFFKRRNHR